MLSPNVSAIARQFESEISVQGLTAFEPRVCYFFLVCRDLAERLTPPFFFWVLLPFFTTVLRNVGLDARELPSSDHRRDRLPSRMILHNAGWVFLICAK